MKLTATTDGTESLQLAVDRKLVIKHSPTCCCAETKVQLLNHKIHMSDCMPPEITHVQGENFKKS